MAIKNSDEAIGRKLRQFRLRIGMSQEQLAKTVGVSFQQIQKYEKGAQSVGAGRLYDLTKALGYPVMAVFDDGEALPVERNGWSAVSDLLSQESQAFIAAYHAIRSIDTRQRVADLVKAVARDERDPVGGAKSA